MFLNANEQDDHREDNLLTFSRQSTDWVGQGVGDAAKERPAVDRLKYRILRVWDAFDELYLTV
jgi:hypothetical protein